MPSEWLLLKDQKTLKSDPVLQVARCTKIINKGK